MLHKVISGGQTGVDRAGLDAAMEAGFPVGGWCPKGRLAEDGTVPDKYPLVEMGSASYTSRTEQNVIDSDGTLVLNKGTLSGGTKRTVDFARKHGRPLLVVQLDRDHEVEIVSRWINENSLHILNVAGPRESKIRGLHAEALTFLRKVFTAESAADVSYPMTEECLITPIENPPPGWVGTWTHREPYE